MRKKIARCLLAICMSAGAFSAIAQPAIPREYIEHPGFSVGLNLGLADLWADVGTQSPVDHYFNGMYWNNTHYMGGIFARYVSHPSLAFRMNLNYGTLYATDEWNKKKAESASSTSEDSYQRYLRNQDIKTNIWEGSLVAEFFPLRMNSESKSASRRLQPYATAGAGLFYTRGFTSYIDPVSKRKKWQDIHNIPLEGEGITYDEATPGFARTSKKFRFEVPLGIGLRWELNSELALGIEYMYRLTMTDRIDHVSSEYPTAAYYDRYLSPEDAAIAKAVSDKSWAIDPSVERKAWAIRGNKDVNDGYSTISIMLVYKLNQTKSPWWY